MLRTFPAADVPTLDRRRAFDDRTLAEARDIVERVRVGGEPALREQARRFGELDDSDPIILDKQALERARRELRPEVESLLRRVADRIERFAHAQRGALHDLDIPVAAGRAGHRVAPVDRAGCYAPGGRFPLPSSALMTAIPARVAGVRDIIVASPRPTTVTLAAAAIAGADALIPIGGAHAIAALAFGTLAPPRDIIVGPGNKWVTAAKHLVSANAGIDMLAGPSELVVIADDAADADTVAADLLAQAEHDTDAAPILITTSEPLASRVNNAVTRRLESLPTQQTARAACANGFIALARDLEQAAALSDALAPEHLQIMTREPGRTAAMVRHYGAIFIGSATAEVAGDYGVGPNHTLPTGGTARFAAGLSVYTFLRARTWIDLDRSSPDYRALLQDTAALARLEGLEAHARAAEVREP